MKTASVGLGEKSQSLKHTGPQELRSRQSNVNLNQTDLSDKQQELNNYKEVEQTTMAGSRASGLNLKSAVSNENQKNFESLNQNGSGRTDLFAVNSNAVTHENDSSQTKLAEQLKK